MASMFRHLNFLRTVIDNFDAEERRLTVQSVVIGVVVWAAVFGLKTAVHTVGHVVFTLLEAQPWWLMTLLVFGFLGVGSLVVALLGRISASVVHYRDGTGHVHQLLDVEGDGLERAIALYYSSEPTFEQSLLGQEGVDVRWQMPTFSLALRKFVATLATLGSGGSGGLEASVSLIGESVAAGLFKPRQRLNLGGRLSAFWRWWQSADPDDLQTAQLSGIAAAVATLIGAPFTAAFFATEVMYRRRPIVEKLVYSLIAALAAFFLNNFVEGGHTPIFNAGPLVVPPLTDGRYYILLVLMAVSIAFVSVGFGRVRARADNWFHHNQSNPWLRHLTGAAITGVIALLVAAGLTLGARNGVLGIPKDTPEHALEFVMGTGERPIEMALTGELVLAVAAVALVAKILATIATIGSGGSAGMLIPSLYFGTMVATFFVHLPRLLGLSELWRFPAMTLVIPAMTASLVAIVNVPLAAILFAIEMFSGSYVVPALVVLVVANLLAFHNTVYRTQREKHEERQILPGYSVRRIPVPLKWDARTLAELQIRRRYGLNVIGWVETNGADGLPHVHLSAKADHPLEADDILVVVGPDENLAAFEAAVSEAEEAVGLTDVAG